MNHPLQEHMMSNLIHRQKTFQAITIGLLSGKLPTHEKLKNLREGGLAKAPASNNGD